MVSLIVLCRNEQRTIEGCLNSIVNQDYPVGRTEVLVVDGMSEDGTRDIVRGFQTRYRPLSLVDNPGKTAPCAFNVGIKAATGGLVLFMSAHATYPNDYVRLCVDTSRRTGADNVGGVCVTKAMEDTIQSRLVRAMTTHRFGVGDAEYRLNASEGPVDTVSLPCYDRKVFERIGWFDERLTRNQDYEFNRRLLAAGGRIWCNPSIRVLYYNQATLGGLFRQAFGTGKWNPWMWFVAPYAFAVRHLVPGLFVVSLFLVLGLWFLVPNGWIAVAAILVPYFVLALLASFQQARRFGFALALPLPALFFTYHVSYGLGTLWGAVRLLVGATPVQVRKGRG
ncbi:MAG: glycosyltransferase family 2 protein [candidate division WOR-3 bacterium]|nr:glycosyltransferase family 2 protein [candidate division WOR-3 bacterium]